jgi:SRSO17 transposase
MSANPVQKAQKSMSAKVCMPRMALSSYLLFRLFVPTIGKPHYPLDFEPYTPAHHFAKGEDDPAFRTKLRIALELVTHAVQLGIPFEAVVADNFYGEDRTLRQGFRDLKLGYVLALKPSHS